MRRRDIVTGAATLATAAAASFPAPAIAQGLRELKLVTDWPEGTPGAHAASVRFAQTVGDATGGRIKIEVFPAGTLVRPFETFDAVGAGDALLAYTTLAMLAVGDSAVATICRVRSGKNSGWRK